jgi:hypothetical protein
MDSNVLQLSGVKKKGVYTYVLLLANGETCEVDAESYYDVSDDEGNPIYFRFIKDKNTVLQIDASNLQTVISKDSSNWETILNAIKKKSPVRKKAKVSK